MITYKRKFNYINELLYKYQFYCDNILCNHLFIMTLRRILFANDEKIINDYFHNFCNECDYRLKMKGD